ncbi:hypothetical protein ACM66B_006613 [Microbotryomycetes sp. NB124-2]
MQHEVNKTLKQLLPDVFERYELRVTMQATMNKLIQTAQDQLKAQPVVPVVLHTLPVAGPCSSSAPSNGPVTSTQPSTSTAVPPPNPDPTQPDFAQPKKKQSSTQTAALSKLVSIAEIVKRKFEPVQDAQDKKGKRKQGLGLYQYTYVGALEDVGFVDGQEESDEAKQERLALQWLKGQAGSDKRPRMRHSPFMVVVLSTKPLRGLAKLSKFTSQRPARRSKKHLATNQPLADKSNEVEKDVPEGQKPETVEKRKRKRVRSRRKSKKAAVSEADPAPSANAGEASAMDET